MPVRRTLPAVALVATIAFGIAGAAEVAGGRPAELQQRLDAALAAKGPGYVPRTEHRLPDGRPRHTNRLILEDSPYLLQHAHNPVDWFPWGEEAFAKARRDEARAVVIVTQANPHFETYWSPNQVRRYLTALPVNVPPARRATGYDDFLAALEREVLAFSPPVHRQVRRLHRLFAQAPCSRGVRGRRVGDQPDVGRKESCRMDTLRRQLIVSLEQALAKG